MIRKLFLLIMVYTVSGACASEEAKISGYQLRKAAAQGNLAQIRQLLGAEVDPNAQCPAGSCAGYTALHCAARKNKSHAVVLLLNNQANVNARTQNLQTPLLIAAKHGKFTAVRTLIEHGAALLACDVDGYTALMYVAQNVLIKQSHAARIVRYLLAKERQKGVRSINLRNRLGETALLIATHDENLDMVRVLIANGAHVACQDNEGNLPLHVASAGYEYQVVAALIRIGLEQVNAQNHDGETPMICAAKNGTSDILEILIEAGADCFLTDKHSKTALDYARERKSNLHQSASECDRDDEDSDASQEKQDSAQADDVDAIISILKKGQVRREERRKEHQLRRYAISGDLDAVKRLFADGVNIDSVSPSGDYAGYTALHCAARKNRRSVIAFLTRHNARVDVRTANGMTPLMVAAKCGKFTAMRSLLSQGAGAAAFDLDGRTALMHGVSVPPQEKGRDKIVRFITMHETLHGRDQGIKSIDIADVYGKTPLHRAAEKENGLVVNELLRAGANVYCRDGNGWMPIHYAAAATHEGLIVIFLAQKDAENFINAREWRWQRTPLIIAVRSCIFDTVDELVDKGADLSAKDISGKTALNYAEEMKSWLERKISSEEDPSGNEDYPTKLEEIIAIIDLIGPQAAVIA